MFDSFPSQLLIRLEPVVSDTLRIVCRAAPPATHIFLIGGVVRDLVLNRPIERDLDLAIEGDLLGLVRGLTAAGAKTVAIHEAFGTATLILNGLQIDLARTRSERYPQPASLPEVTPASIAADLARRDFSLNAMAFEVLLHHDQLQAGAWLDPFDGYSDLRAKQLRILHSASFRDDPTRILRGLRIAARLDLQLETETRRLMLQSLARCDLELLTPERVRNELCLALSEPLPEAVLQLADAWGMTPQLQRTLRWTPELRRRVTLFRSEPPPWPINVERVLLGLLIYDLNPSELAKLSLRYRLANDLSRFLNEIGRLQVIAAELDPQCAASYLDRSLRPFSPDALTVVHYAERLPLSQCIADYLRHLRNLPPILDGDDLRTLGVAPGPMLGRLLTDLRAAHLDGLISSREEAERWVLKQLATVQRPPSP